MAASCHARVSTEDRTAAAPGERGATAGPVVDPHGNVRLRRKENR